MEHPHVDLDHLRDLMKLMDQFSFDELEVREGTQRLHLLRRPRGSGNHAPQAVVVPTMVGGAAPAGGGDAAPALAEGVSVVKSPMVGTFYSSPSPDAGPFVAEGDEVKEDQVLCIIEAMKVMNEIKADSGGTIVKVLVANGEAVEYGEPLFHVRRA